MQSLAKTDAPGVQVLSTSGGKESLTIPNSSLSAFCGCLSNHQVVEPRYSDFCLLLVNYYREITVLIHTEPVFLF